MATVKKIFPGSAPKAYTADGDLRKTWFVYYTATDGKRVKITRGINTQQTEEGRMQVIDAIIADLLRMNPHAGKPELVLALYRFLDSKRTRRPKTYAQYQSRVRKFETYYRGGEFGLRQADRYLDYLTEKEGLSAVSRNDTRQFFLSAFDWLMKRGLWPENPFRGTEKISATKTPYRYFQKTDIKRLRRIISARDPELWLFCQFVYYTFIRPGELRQVKVSDILWDDMKIVLRKEVSKNRKQQYVHIPLAFFPILENAFGDSFPGHYLFGRGGGPGVRMVGANNFSQRHRNILREAGYQHPYVLYSWKHTGAVQFVRSGGSMKALQLQLRHHSLDQVDQYLRDLGVQDMPDLDLFPEI